MSDYGLETHVYEINRRAAEIARRAADEYTRKDPEKPRFVAGSMGPTTRTSSISPDVTNPAFRAIRFDELERSFYEQAKGLLDGGCDLLLPETFIDTLNIKAALAAIQRLFRERGKRIRLSPRSPSSTRAAGTSLGRHRKLSGSRSRTLLFSESASTARSGRRRCGPTSRSSLPYRTSS